MQNLADGSKLLRVTWPGTTRSGGRISSTSVLKLRGRWQACVDHRPRGGCSNTPMYHLKTQTLVVPGSFDRTHEAVQKTLKNLQTIGFWADWAWRLHLRYGRLRGATVRCEDSLPTREPLPTLFSPFMKFPDVRKRNLSQPPLWRIV